MIPHVSLTHTFKISRVSILGTNLLSYQRSLKPLRKKNANQRENPTPRMQKNPKTLSCTADRSPEERVPCGYRNGFNNTIHCFTLPRSKPWQAKCNAEKLRYSACHLLAAIPRTDRLDLPISIYEADESAEFIIVDDNGGQAIIIDSSDDEMCLDKLDDDDSGQSPRRRAQRKRSTRDGTNQSVRPKGPSLT